MASRFACIRCRVRLEEAACGPAEALLGGGDPPREVGHARRFRRLCLPVATQRTRHAVEQGAEKTGPDRVEPRPEPGFVLTLEPDRGAGGAR